MLGIIVGTLVWYDNSERESASSEAYNRKEKANMKSGKISDNFSRHVIINKRPKWEEKVKNDGLSYYNLEGLKWSTNEKADADCYWNEEGYAEITQKSEKEILEATF